MTRSARTEALRAANARLMPRAVQSLRRLVSRPSVSLPGFPSEPVTTTALEVVSLFMQAGLSGVRLLDIEDGYPAVYADAPGPPGAPTVLLYAHYDVWPASAEQGWSGDPFVMTECDGRLRGRGAADDKSGLVIHANALRLFRGHPPVGIKLLVEGEHEAPAARLEAFVEANPEMFSADVIVIADMGNILPGEPMLTTALRGRVRCAVETHTLERPLEADAFCGVAPDALTALVRVLDALWAEDGSTAVPGLHAFEWPGASYPETTCRRVTRMLPNTRVMGDGSVASALWSRPDISITAVDASPPTRASHEGIRSSARADVAMRIAPGADAARELTALMDHLRARRPWGVEVATTPIEACPGLRVESAGICHRTARAALAEAYGRAPSEVGGGAPIPLLHSLAAASPGAELILWGAQDADANVHGADESVDPGEIERMALAQALLLARLGDEWKPQDRGE